eukprot:GHVP01053214.1.p1 GENE.GHVP01053214.1~~GHVP01053214.1.p1  ORF type:complete len:325 (-),score=62.61 GHVP01053214.1:144-1118(-)
MKKDTDKDYFDSYSHFGVHESMLKDATRTLAYKKAIMGNPHLFKDKVVLDIGCGTGILSLFAAKAGSKKVYAVDNSSISENAKIIIQENGWDDIITVIKGKVEEIVLPVEKIDIIISEWMGHILLYESMLNSVIWARNKYLKKDGFLFPDKAIIYMNGVEDCRTKNEMICFWDDVYGFDMSSMVESVLKEPQIETISDESVVTSTAVIKNIDLNTVEVEDLSFVSQFKLTFTSSDMMQGFLIYFDCVFSVCSPEIVLSTGPASPETHWRQALLYLRDDILADQDKEITGEVSLKEYGRDSRGIQVDIKYKYSDHEEKELSFKMH